MSNFCDVNLTVKNGCADVIANYIFNDTNSDLCCAFGENDPDVNESGIHFWGINAVNYGIATEEMVAISKAFPNALFELWTRDENGCESMEYFKNGKCACYEPIITWPKFSEDDLEEVE